MDRNSQGGDFVRKITFLLAALALVAGGALRAEEAAPGLAADLSGRVEVSAGNLGAREYSGRVRAALERFAAYAAGSYREGEGFRDNDESERRAADAGIEYGLGWAGTLRPGFEYADVWRQEAGYKDARTPRAEARDAGWAAKVEWEYRGAAVRLAYRDTIMDDEDPDQGLDSRVREQSWGPEVAGAWKRGREAEFQYETGYIWSGISPDRGSVVPETRAWALVRETLEPADAPLRLVWGLRADSYSAFGDAWSPEARVRYGNNLFYVEAGYELAAAAPDLARRYRRTSYAIPDAGLGLERAHDFRLTVYSDAYDSPTVSASFYFREIEDAVVLARTPGPAGVYRSVGRATARGIDFSFMVQPADEVQVDLAYTYEEARDEDRDRWLPGRPRHQARVQVVYAPVEELTITAVTRYVSSAFTFADNSREISDYYLTDLAAEYRMEEAVFFGRVDNLFDRRYDYGLGYPGPPLTWTAGLRYEW